MSLFSKILKPLKKPLRAIGKTILKGASVIPGPVGAIARVAGIAGTAIAGARAVSSVLPGRGSIGPRLPGMGMQAGVGLPALPGLGAAGGRVLTGIGAGAAVIRRNAPGLMRIGKKAADALGYIAAGKYLYDSMGNLVGQKPSRRMNPLNPRALTRSIRRVKSAKKFLKQVEKLTGGSSRRSVSCAPKRKARC